MTKELLKSMVDDYIEASQKEALLEENGKFIDYSNAVYTRRNMRDRIISALVAWRQGAPKKAEQMEMFNSNRENREY